MDIETHFDGFSDLRGLANSPKCVSLVGAASSNPFLEGWPAEAFS
jgi:hypothetical protein